LSATTSGAREHYSEVRIVLDGFCGETRIVTCVTTDERNVLGAEE
jgi:hypothetical protein